MLDYIKNEVGDAKALVKKEKNVVAVKNYDIYQEISALTSLPSSHWKNLQLECIAKRLYTADNENKHEILSNVTVKKLRMKGFFMLGGYLAVCPFKDFFQQHLYLSNFKDIKNFNLRKAYFLTTYFHENQHIQQINMLRKACTQKFLLNHTSIIIISELLKNSNDNYKHMLSEIQANYIALKRYKHFMDKGIIPNTPSYVYMLLEMSTELFKNINSDFVFKSNFQAIDNLKNIEKTAKEMELSLLENVQTALGCKSLSYQQKVQLLQNFKCANTCSNLRRTLLTISQFCLDTCKEYNEKISNTWFIQPKQKINEPFNAISNAEENAREIVRMISQAKETELEKTIND